MLLVIDRAYRNGVISLEQGVRLVTSAPADAIPGLAPDRGVVATDRVADLVVTFPNELAKVKDVLISGRSVTAHRRERT
jgi:alpha-D-ribose 1-methylphosphonate 5-triphosphate diphosphatase PhnM